ncbi:MAG TPA: FKBP-type peptidyl-prolyl cis-trans isomerase [Edaphobacter sp.]
MKLTPSLTLLATLATVAAAQTSTTAKKPTTTTAHRAAASTTKPAAAAAPAANPADNPPNVPKVEGAPKNLYALRYVDIVVGTGELAQQRRYYTVHYTGWLTDGTKFDSSVDRGAPFTFPYGAHRVIPGWDTGFEGMRVGGKRRLFVPWQLAYGETGHPPVIPPKADLIFDVEFIGQSETPPAPPQSANPAGSTGSTESKPAASPSETKPTTQPAPDAKPSDTKTPPHPETH